MVSRGYNHLSRLGREELITRLESLGVLARDESSRVTLGDQGAIEGVTSLLARKDHSEKEVQLELRLLANLVAENDKNRSRAVASHVLPDVCHHLASNNTDIRGKACIAIYNLCINNNDEETLVSDMCLKEAILFNLPGALIDMLALHKTTWSTEYVLQLLSMIYARTSCTPTAKSLAVILSIQIDYDELASHLDCITTMLNHSVFRQVNADREIFPDLLRVLYNAHNVKELEKNVDDLPAARRRYFEKILSLSYELGVPDQCLEVLSHWGKGEAGTEADVSTFHFSENTRARFQEYACLLFGNQIRNDEQAVLFAQQPPVPLWTLISALKDSEDWALVHAIAGLMKNLSLPISNKKFLGDIGLLEACQLLLKNSTVPSLGYLGASLIRSLCNDCNDNITRILISRKASYDENVSRDLTDLESIFADVLRCSRSSSEECGKWEASRTIVLVVKYLHRSANQKSFEELDVFDGAKSWAVTALLEMSKDAKWDMIRLEGLLGLALLAAVAEFRQLLRTHDATESCDRIINDPSQSHTLKENARVLLARLNEN